MKTELSAGNPFGYDRYGYAWERTRQYASGGRHLDYGSYDGHVARQFLKTGIVSTAVAADVVDVESNYRQRFEVSTVETPEFAPVENYRLAYPDGSFDSASLLDVLEHVADQQAVLSELRRLLKPGGLLVVTVPARHLFSFLDTGNWKFRFPRLHRWFYVRRHSRSEYETRYRNSESGLIGDIEAAKSWHEHFSPENLASVLRMHCFEPIDLDGAGCLARPLAIAKYLAPEGLSRRLDILIRIDASWGSATHLFSTSRRARKSST